MSVRVKFGQFENILAAGPFHDDGEKRLHHESKTINII